MIEVENYASHPRKMPTATQLRIKHRIVGRLAELIIYTELAGIRS